MMFRAAVLLTLLISSVCSLQWEVYEVESAGHEESSGEIMARSDHGLPGMCWACKWTMRKVKKQISVGATQNDIQNKLINICNEIGFLKSLCKSFVSKYTSVLVEELSTTDNPTTICVNVGVCKK